MRLRTKPPVRQTVTNRPLRGREKTTGGHLATVRLDQNKQRGDANASLDADKEMYWNRKQPAFVRQGAGKKEARSGDKKQLEMARSVQI